MTALVMQLTPRQVSIAADTLVMGAGRAVDGLASKIFVAPHLNMAMAGTGSLWALIRLGDWLQYVPHRGGFDEIAAQLPAAVAEIAGEFEAIPDKSEAFAAAFAKTDAFVFGWSEAANSFAMRVYCMGENGRTVDGFPGVWANPHLGKKPREWPRLRSEGDFFAIVKRQQESELAKPAEIRSNIGGDVVLLEMWRARFEWSRIGRLPIPSCE